MKMLPLLLSLSLLLCACGGSSPNAILTPTESSASDTLYFAETGHIVQPPFVAWYRQHNGPSRLGYPITESMEIEGWQVQYFQYGRLEAHPENQPDYFITVGWLGQLSHRTQPPQPPMATHGTLFFPETGHGLNGDFLAYFQENGDTVQFGKPISGVFMNNGHLVQDFRSARFIWQPWLPPSAQVQLEPLGETHFLASGLPLSLLSPITAPANAELFSPPETPIPADVIANLTVEPTPHPEVLRIVATLFADEIPIEGAALWLGRNGIYHKLPLTRSAGQTHALVDVTDSETLSFTLSSDPAGESVLALLTYSPDKK